MSRPLSKEPILSNIGPPVSATTASPPASASEQHGSVSPEQRSRQIERKDSPDTISTQKNSETEGKKRKRSQRACARCRGQKLKCDGIFPCARCLKLKLVCKEPSEGSIATSSSSKILGDERDTGSSAAASLSRTGSILYSTATAGALHPSSSASSSTFPALLDRPVVPERPRHSGSHALSSRPNVPQFDSLSRSSLPDAVRRIESLERIVYHLSERVEGSSDGGRRAVMTPTQPDRRRLRADSLIDSETEMDELALDAPSEVGVPQRLAHDVQDIQVRSRRSSLASPESPLDAGIVTREIAKNLLEIFCACCRVYAPFLDLEEHLDLLVLSTTEPFLLSCMLSIAALYPDPRGHSDAAARSDVHLKLSSHVAHNLGFWLCRPDPTVSVVQALMLIASWPQAFPVCPDDRLLFGYASALLQAIAYKHQLDDYSTDARYSPLSSRITTLWTSLRALEALTAFDSGRAMYLTDQDVALSNTQKSSRVTASIPFIVRAIPVLKEVQAWLVKLSLMPLLPVIDPVKQPLARANYNHDWNRFKFLQTQLLDIEKRWLASETENDRLERIVGLIERWNIQLYLGVIALRAIELSLASWPNDEAGHFVAAYRHEILQACQVLMDIYTDPELGTALQYVPGYHLRHFAQATVAMATLFDIHDTAQAHLSQEAIHDCIQRLKHLSQATSTPYVRTLLSHVKHACEKHIGTDARQGRDFPTTTFGRQRDAMRWTTTDIFTIMFGYGLVLRA